MLLGYELQILSESRPILGNPRSNAAKKWRLSFPFLLGDFATTELLIDLGNGSSLRSSMRWCVFGYKYVTIFHLEIISLASFFASIFG